MDTYQLASITLNEAKFILRKEQFLSKGIMQAERKEITRKGIFLQKSVSKCVELFGEYAESISNEWQG